MKEEIIDNVFDYSDRIVDIESLTTICRRAEKIFNDFQKKYEDDEIKNEKLKWEFKNHEFKKGFNNLNYYMTFKDYSSMHCETSEALIKAYNSSNIKVTGITLTISMDYLRGINNLFHITNEFIINIKPYETYLERRSNYNDACINEIESSINQMFERMPVVKTIFN